MEVIKDLPPDEWPGDFKLASMVLDLSEKRSAQSLVLNDHQPLAGLDASELSRLTSTRPRTTRFSISLYFLSRKVHVFHIGYLYPCKHYI